MRKGELDLGRSVLHTIVTLQISRLDGSRTDDLNGTRTGPVSAGHLIVQLRDGACKLDVAKLAVHIVSSRSTVVTQPDAVVLDDTVVLLDEFDAIDNFTCGLLHLTELMHVVPELGLGNHLVGGKDDHTVGLGVGVIIGGSLSADHLVLLHESGDSHLDVV